MPKKEAEMEKDPKRGRDLFMILGGIIVIAGIALTLYAAYTAFSRPSFYGQRIPGYVRANMTQNSTFNQSAINDRMLHTGEASWD